ncbi:MAG: hypothetical protein HY070_05570 [Chloroflexi bacterium]|nr:hypothetical protein [Chloroflexota bacterium]
MDETTLAPWRDLALVWFAILGAIVVAIPGVIFFYLLRGVQRFKIWLQMPLLNSQLVATRIQLVTLRASSAVIALPIAIASARARVRGTLRGLANFLRGV